MKASELRNLGDDELGVKERELTDQLFRMRIQKSMGQLEAPDKLRTVRRETKSVCGATVPLELASYIRATSSWLGPARRNGAATRPCA